MQAAQGILVLTQHIGDSTYHFTTPGRGKKAPAGECRAADIHDLLVLSGAAATHRGDGIAGCGIDTGDQLTARCTPALVAGVVITQVGAGILLRQAQALQYIFYIDLRHSIRRILYS
jgi:hypothetical protein